MEAYTGQVEIPGLSVELLGNRVGVVRHTKSVGQYESLVVVRRAGGELLLTLPYPMGLEQRHESRVQGNGPNASLGLGYRIDRNAVHNDARGDDPEAASL